MPKDEPQAPEEGWTYPVAVPFIPPQASSMIATLVDQGQVSSATKSVHILEDRLRKFYNVPTAVACSNGYSSLVLALMAARIKPGSHILVPSMTMCAVANAVLAVGAFPIFVDSAPGQLNPGIDQYLARMTDQVRCVITTNTYGIAPDLPAVVEMCDNHGWILIEDISEAIGTQCRDRLVGTFGAFGCASLYANKLITAGDGGFVISKLMEPDELLRSLRNHGFQRLAHFVHLESSGNFRINGLGAALAAESVPHIGSLLKHREHIANKFRQWLDGIPGLRCVPPAQFGPDAPWVFGVILDPEMNRGLLRAQLAERGIETRDFFFPLHWQPFACRNQDVVAVNSLPNLSLPEAEKLGVCGFYLPTHAMLCDRDIDFIGAAIRDILRATMLPNLLVTHNSLHKYLTSCTLNINGETFKPNLETVRKQGSGENHSNYVVEFQTETTTINVLCRQVVESVDHCVDMRKEFNSLQELNQVLPGLFPKVFSLDDSATILLLEFISGVTLAELKEMDSDILTEFGKSLARLHCCTKPVSSLNHFHSFRFKKVITQFIRSYPIAVPSTVRQSLSHFADIIEDEFSWLADHDDVVLSHGDAILANAVASLSGEVRFIDAEDVRYKFSGYDLATVVYESCLPLNQAMIIINAYASARWPENPHQQSTVATLIAEGAKLRGISCVLYGLEKLWLSLLDPTGSTIRTVVNSLLEVFDNYQKIPIMASFNELITWLRLISIDSSVRSHTQIHAALTGRLSGSESDHYLHLIQIIASMVQRNLRCREFCQSELIDELSNYLRDAISNADEYIQGVVATMLESWTADLSFRLLDNPTTSEEGWHSLIYENTIETTTEDDSLKCLSWLAASTQGAIIDVGVWLGASTACLARGLRQRKCQTPPSQVFVLDSFIWDSWMDRYTRDVHLNTGDSFLKLFLSNTREFADVIQVKPWTFFPGITKNDVPWSRDEIGEIGLLHFDLGCDYWEIKCVWRMFHKSFVPEKTLLVINTYGNTESFGVRRFVREHRDQLRLRYDPKSNSKVFLFLGKRSNPMRNSSQQLVIPSQSICRKICVPNKIQWLHHRAGWTFVLEVLRNTLHCDDGVLFIDSVEDSVFEGRIIHQPWVGVLHQVPQYEHQCFPDLERLCDNSIFQASLEQCCGLFIMVEAFKEWMMTQRMCIHVPVCTFPYCLPAIGEVKFDFDLYVNTHPRTVLFIGEYLRDFEAFFNLSLPQDYRKIILNGNTIPSHIERNETVEIMPYISNDEYDHMMTKSIVFLHLFDSAANTTALECICFFTPIIVNRLPALEQYLGTEYPLFYTDLQQVPSLIQNEALIRTAHLYLQCPDLHERLSQNRMIEAIHNSSVYRGLPVPRSQCIDFKRYDVSIILCSFKRVNILASLLNRLEQQDFHGDFEVILWNNNYSQREAVDALCAPFQQSGNRLNLKVIHSSENYYCIIRCACMALVRSPLVICIDDDVRPSQYYIRKFLAKYDEYGPNCALCLRGHLFYNAQIDDDHPEIIWQDDQTRSDYMTFFDEFQSDCRVHFMHADNLLIPTALLQRVISYLDEYEDILVDDYWFSFVLSHHLHVDLWKVQGNDIISFDDSADDPTIALSKQSVVQQQRIKFYLKHMRAGWPFQHSLEPHQSTIATAIDRHLSPSEIWERGFHGVNMDSTALARDFQAAAAAGVRVVRLGACCGAQDFRYLVNDTFDVYVFDSVQREALKRSIHRASSAGLHVILTLVNLPGRDFQAKDTRMWKSPFREQLISLWEKIAEFVTDEPGIIGFDLINEPFVASDVEESKISNEELTSVKSLYVDLIAAIRRSNSNKYIIIESTNWAAPSTLSLLNPCDFHDPLLAFSFHFYEPRVYTSNIKTALHYTYPGLIESSFSSSLSMEWNIDELRRQILSVVEWQAQNSIISSRVFVGEFGVYRKCKGGCDYLRDVMTVLNENGWSWTLYAFRENAWDGMDYEYGSLDLYNIFRHTTGNELFEVIQKEFK
jgi:dTDP-4-amino-4,6-dideoxygalactose transaminase